MARERFGSMAREMSQYGMERMPCNGGKKIFVQEHATVWRVLRVRIGLRNGFFSGFYLKTMRIICVGEGENRENQAG